MKWNFNLPYRREAESRFHYPEVSRVTGKPIDWYHGEPDDGYEGARIYGEHTLELKGMPLGRTPEYMQERLRRFFAKFGPVKHCRAEPHKHDPYQCEGTAYVTFRDNDAALKALAAPLKFPASLHDKVISMKHLDSGKQNDPDYYEKSKFWDREVINLAGNLHKQLCADPTWRDEGKPLSLISRGLFENELIEGGPERPLPLGRGGIPWSKGGLAVTAKTRRVAAHGAVKQRFGSWQAFLIEAPFDQLFRMETRVGNTGSAIDPETEVPVDEPLANNLVVVPKLLSDLQRSRLLARAKLSMGRRLHDEFSKYWREGKIALPEYTQRRVEWWDHTPPLPFELQIMSRPRDRFKIFDERFLYRRQLIQARNERRREKRTEWSKERTEIKEEVAQKIADKKANAAAAVEQARCGHLLGKGLYSPVAGATKGRPN